MPAQQRPSRAEQCPIQIHIQAAHARARPVAVDAILRIECQPPPKPSLGNSFWPRAAKTSGSFTTAPSPAQEPRWVEVPDDLHPLVAQALTRRGSTASTSTRQLALRSAFAGPTIVTTGTASGKSLCFQLPTLEVLVSDPSARALYLYPTKALAQDQARALQAFGLTRQIRPADLRRRHAPSGAPGDPQAQQPDHHQPGHAARGDPAPPHPWADLFANLAFVVVDEAHVYRGVFGSHVANVLRRLRRAAAFHGTAPRFLLASATIANPVELAEGLTGLPEINLIDARHRSSRSAPRRRSGTRRCWMSNWACGPRRCRKRPSSCASWSSPEPGRSAS